MKRLLIAYGNRDREDDGAGWHILNRFAELHDLPTPQWPGESVDSMDGNLRLLYLFQLVPEMAEDLNDWDEVIFIDAHNSEQLPPLSFAQVRPSNAHSAFTHHLSAEELLGICQTISGSYPTSKVLSVRGVSFRFKPELSQQTSKTVDEAVGILIKHLNGESS
ncbi:MAG: hydrogenase maturation protease [Anaerolineaceae bacterium]|jgi:hydrogenase maturation protease